MQNMLIMKIVLLALGASAAQQHPALHGDGILVLLQQGARAIRHTKDLARGAAFSLASSKDAEPSACEDWCESELFVKVEANTTLLKNLSSWAMKCGWAYCGGCTACSDPAILAAETRLPNKDPFKHASVQSASCDDWCAGEVFEVVHQNMTSSRHFGWDNKCAWSHCGACSECTSLVQEAVISEHKDVSSHACEDWCESELFVKVEANTTALKNLSSWSMKCTWAYCGGCNPCSDPAILAAEARLPKKDSSKHFSAPSAQSASCDDWCSSEVFEIVHQNITSDRQFGWDKKCNWYHCGACSECTSLLQEAALSDTRWNPFAGWIKKLTGSGESVQEEQETSEKSTGGKKLKKVTESGKKVNGTEDEETIDKEDRKVAANTSGNKTAAKTTGNATGARTSGNQTAAKTRKQTSASSSGNGVSLFSEKADTCEDWCESELFVKVEANTTALKNLSSWTMKCTWAYCGGCNACSDPAILAGETRLPKKDSSKHFSAQSASCDDWCSSEVFEIVRQNITSDRQFGWDKKCHWSHCGACSACTSLLQEAALSDARGNPFAGWIKKLTGSGESVQEEQETNEKSTGGKKLKKSTESGKKVNENKDKKVAAKTSDNKTGSHTSSNATVAKTSGNKTAAKTSGNESVDANRK